MKLVDSMDDEQKRYVREGFDSDEELIVYDLLCKDKELTKNEIKSIKKLSQDMLKEIKDRIHELDHWRNKEETQAMVSILIRDILWAQLPESYDDKVISDYRQRIYEHIFANYSAI